MAMGNSLSPFLCNLYVNKLEEKLKLNVNFPRIWRRYVDDVLAVVKRNKIDDVLQLINSVCPKIQFTVEKEEDGKIPSQTHQYR